MLACWRETLQVQEVPHENSLKLKAWCEDLKWFCIQIQRSNTVKRQDMKKFHLKTCHCYWQLPRGTLMLFLLRSRCRFAWKSTLMLESNWICVVHPFHVEKGEITALSILFFGVFYTKPQIALSPSTLPHHYIFCVSSLPAPVDAFFRIYILENGFSVTWLVLWQQSLPTKPFCLHTCGRTLLAPHCPTPFPVGPVHLFEERVMLFYSQTAGHCCSDWGMGTS